MTIFSRRIYVAREKSNELEVYALTAISPHNRIRLIIPQKYRTAERQYVEPYASGIASCDAQKCLYVSDERNSCVLRLRTSKGEGGDIASLTCDPWPVSGEPRGISVSKDGNILVSCFKANKLFQFTVDGLPLREIILEEGSGTVYPYHAEYIAGDEFLITYQYSKASTFGVCMVDEDGDVVDCYGDSLSGDMVDGKSLDKLNKPLHFAVDVSGRFVVADCNNDRIKLFSPSLEDNGDVLTKDDVTQPTILYINQDLGLMFVGLMDGRVSVFCIDESKLEEAKERVKFALTQQVSKHKLILQSVQFKTFEKIKF